MFNISHYYVFLHILSVGFFRAQWSLNFRTDQRNRYIVASRLYGKSCSAALFLWISCYAKNSLWCFRPFPEPTLLERRRVAGPFCLQKKGRKCLTKFCWIFEFGAVHCQRRLLCAPSFLYFPQASLHCCCLLVSSPGLCFSPGWRLPEALFTVFRFDPKGANVCKFCRFRQELSNEYLLAKFGVDTAENRPLKVCQKLLVAKS